MGNFKLLESVEGCQSTRTENVKVGRGIESQDKGKRCGRKRSIRGQAERQDKGTVRLSESGVASWTQKPAKVLECRKLCKCYPSSGKMGAD